MAVNIGPKIGIEGEREYRKQINDLITQQKTFSAEMRALESSFDDTTSAMEKNKKKAQLLSKQIQNQEKQVEELEKGLEAAADTYGENATETQKWKQAVANAKTELNKMKKELKGIPSSMQAVGSAMQSAGKKMQSVGATLTKSVTAPLVAMGAASVAAWKDVDDGMDIVVKKTGATGEALVSMQNTAKEIAKTIPTSFETAGEAVGEVNTRFGLTGTALEDLSTRFIKFADLNNTDVSSSIDTVQKVMEAYGVSTEDAGKLLDALNRTGQNTGISMDTLENSMVKNAAALKSMGLDAYDAAGFLGQVETSGVGTETVMSGLSKALTNASKDGKTLPDALAEFQGVMNSTATDQEKLTAACELFGKKAGPAIYEACQTGSLSFETLSADASTYLGSVETTFDNTIDPIDSFTTTLNKVKDAGSKIGGALLEIAAPAIESLGGAAESAADWFESLSKDQQEMVAYAGLFAAGIGPAITAVGDLAEGAGRAITAIGNLTQDTSILGSLISPAGLAIGGLIAMSAAMASARQKGLDSNETLQEILGTLTSATDELNTATEGLETTVSDAQDNLDSINAKADSADKLVTELFKLEKQSNKTAVEQARMKMIVDELNEMYPGLGLSIDQTTGKLNKGKGAVKEYINAAKDMALLDAYGRAAQETLDALVKESVAYEKALAAQGEGTKTIAQLQQEYNQALADAPTSWNGQGVWDEASKTFKVVTLDITNASNALKAAEEKQVELNGAVDDATVAMDSAQEEYDIYIKAQEDLKQKIGESTSEQENQTEATEENTEAVQKNSEALAEKVKAAMDVGKQVVSTIADTQREVQAWDDLYQATYDSITGQIGLFDEWTQESELTAQDMLHNLQTQTEGFANYASNMETLSRMAEESSDPNFKALVQDIAKMGIDGAGYLQELVNTAETDSELFNALIAEYGNTEAAKENAAKIMTDVENEFTSKSEIIAKGANKALSLIGESKVYKNAKKGVKDFVKNLGDEAKKMAKTSQEAGQQTANNLTDGTRKGYSNLVTTAKSSTTLAVKDTQERISKMNLKPEIKQVGVSPDATSGAKSAIETGASGAKPTIPTISVTARAISAAKGEIQTGASGATPTVRAITVPENAKRTAKSAIQTSLSGVTGSVGAITGGAAAGKKAHQDAQSNFGNVTGKVELSGAAAAARDARQKIRNEIGTVYVPVAAKTSSQIRPYAEGGFITEEQVAMVGEQNKPEVIIPLSASKRSRALDLYQETGEILGLDKAGSLGRTTRKTLPSRDTTAVSASGSGGALLDTEKIYSAVAAGAQRGMEKANIRIYTNNREVGRLMRNMGVQFA